LVSATMFAVFGGLCDLRYDGGVPVSYKLFMLFASEVDVKMTKSQWLSCCYGWNVGYEK